MSWKVAGASLVGNLILGWLLLQAHKDIGAAVAACNAEQLLAVTAAQTEVRDTLERVHAAELARRDRQLEIQAEARKTAEAERLQALKGVESRDLRIRQLELEAFDDDIPDSKECLNVFTISDSVERMWWDESCHQAGDSDGDGNEGCTDSGGFAGHDRPDFANLTYGDALFAWNHDRNSLRSCNTDKRAIKAISENAAQTF